MKVYILTDLEGPDGVNGRSDGIGNQILNKDVAAEALTNEVNACCEGLVKAGADEIRVLDGHGGSATLNALKLHPAAQLMQVGRWAPTVAVDASFDAMVQLGAHGMQQSGGHMCHTFNSHGVQWMKLNGAFIGEIGVCSYLGAYFGVPTILVSGDDTACAEAQALLGSEVETVMTKHGVNRYTAVNRPPKEVYAEMTAKAEKALKALSTMKPLPMPEHLQLDVRVMCPNQTWGPEMLGIELLDEVTMRYVSDDMVDLWSQRLGWAPGVHNRRFGITPQWRG